LSEIDNSNENALEKYLDPDRLGKINDKKV